MVGAIKAVLSDGSVPPGTVRPLVPFEQPLSHAPYEDTNLYVTLVGTDGAPISLTGTLTLTIRRRPEDEDPALVRRATVLNVAQGKGAFPITAGDLTDIETPAILHYDVTYSDAAGVRSQVVPRTHFTLREPIGRPGEAVTTPPVQPGDIPDTFGVLAMTSADARAAIGNVEQLVDQTIFDFSLLGGLTVQAQLAALTEQTGGASGTYRVRVGGTNNQPDGAIVAVLTTTHAAIVLPPDKVVGDPFTNLVGSNLLKLTAVASAVGEYARIRHYQIAMKTIS